MGFTVGCKLDTHPPQFDELRLATNHLAQFREKLAAKKLPTDQGWASLSRVLLARARQAARGARAVPKAGVVGVPKWPSNGGKGVKTLREGQKRPFSGLTDGASVPTSGPSAPTGAASARTDGPSARTRGA